jgi:hypothetical protein
MKKYRNEIRKKEATDEKMIKRDRMKRDRKKDRESKGKTGRRVK